MNASSNETFLLLRYALSSSSVLTIRVSLWLDTFIKTSGISGFIPYLNNISIPPFMSPVAASVFLEAMLSSILAAMRSKSSSLPVSSLFMLCSLFAIAHALSGTSFTVFISSPIAASASSRLFSAPSINANFAVDLASICLDILAHSSGSIGHDISQRPTVGVSMASRMFLPLPGDIKASVVYTASVFAPSISKISISAA